MKGCILKRYDGRYFTYLKPMLAPIEDIVRQYNWLVTDCEVYDLPDSRFNSADYVWLSGDELLDIAQHKSQFIWAVFSAIPKHVPREQAMLGEPLPQVEEYVGCYHSPLRIQHSLAEIEFLAIDSSYVIFISKHDALVAQWAAAFEHAMDLDVYIDDLRRKYPGRF
ncbi:MAG: hypothetical protein FWE40_09815 [Oscillospiraceae bacterium]|nr:hypothetical protein [Oscillospiraceae bacterium]